MFSFIKDNLFMWLIIFLIIVAPSFLFGAVQVFVYIILALVLLAFIGGLVLRWKVNNLRKRAQGGGDFDGYANTKSRGWGKSEPDVKVYGNATSTGKKVSDDVGDYVDFEEIKEK